MNSSSTIIPEPHVPSNQGSYSEATATVARELQENTNPNPNLPPFKILIKWLAYYHTQTGAWPELGEDADLIVPTSTSTSPSSQQQTGKKPPLTLVPNRPKTVKLAAPGEGFGIAAAVVNYALPLRSSIYYLTAQELIKKYTPAAQIVSETRNLVLASFLALCHHPVFLTEQKEKEGDGEGDLRPRGLGMYLPLGQWSKALRMRKATLGNFLKELETWGLIECCSSQTEVELNYSKPLNRYYRLAVLLPEQLPVFTLDLEASIPEKREPVRKAKASEPLLVIVPPEGTGSGAGGTSMNMVSKIHDLKNIKTKMINHDHESGPVVAAGTTEEKLEFLACKATFPGYSSPEGLTVLASGEALKFAVNPALDLSTLRQVYNQVLATWTSGKCTKNPLGFFHYTLTQRLKQKESRSVKPFVSEQIAVQEREPLFGNRVTKEVVFQPESVPGYSEDKATANAVEEQMAVIEVAPAAAALMAPVETAPEIDLKKLEQELKEQVVEALAGRFRQPELADLVSRLDWRCCLLDAKLFVKLENSGNYSLLRSGLTQGHLSLLRIALSQKIKNTLGNSMAFELVV